VWHPRLLVEAFAEAGMKVDMQRDGREIAFNDDVTRRRVPLAVDRIACVIGAPPTPRDAAAAYARWALAHREWFA
jgi:hypothetical protein